MPGLTGGQTALDGAEGEQGELATVIWHCGRTGIALSGRLLQTDAAFVGIESGGRCQLIPREQVFAVLPGHRPRGLRPTWPFARGPAAPECPGGLPEGGAR